jgi:hypothetical protein
MPGQPQSTAPAAASQEETGMPYHQSPTFLRRALLLDAVASGATGLLLIAGAGLLEGLLGLPTTLLRSADLVPVPYVAFVTFTGTRGAISPRAVWTIVTANAL